MTGGTVAGGHSYLVGERGPELFTPGRSGMITPNGAGKSTTMRMIGGTSLRTSGTLRVLGLDPEERGPEVRASLGVVPQTDSLDEELRVRDNLIVYGRYFGLPRSYLEPKADELLAFARRVMAVEVFPFPDAALRQLRREAERLVLLVAGDGPA